MSAVNATALTFRSLNRCGDAAASQNSWPAEEGGGSRRRPVVVGVDGSQAALAAVRWAAEEARLRKTTLVIVTALGEPFADAGADRRQQSLIAAQRRLGNVRLAEARDMARSAPSIRCQIVPTSPGHGLLAVSPRAAMLVLGARRTRHDAGVGDQVVEAVSRTSGCPIVLVPAAFDPVRAAGGSYVVARVDEELPNARSVLNAATHESSLRGAGLRIVHYHSDGTGAPGTEPDRVGGHPGEAALLVIGCRWRPGFSGLCLDSLSAAVPRILKCPVMIVRGPQGESRVSGRGEEKQP